MAGWDFHAFVDEGFLNAAINAVRDQRPSLFNYATPRIGGKALRLCRPIARPANGAPPVTLIEPLVLGQTPQHRLLLEYCYQLTELRIDFRPAAGGGDPDFRLTGVLCVGLGFPEKVPAHDMLLPPPDDYDQSQIDNPIDFDELKCFCTRIQIDGSARFEPVFGAPALLFQVDDVEIDDCDTPLLEMLETMIEGVLNAAVLPQAAFSLPPLEFAAPDGNPPPIKLEIKPATGFTNPSFADDRLNLYFEIQ